MKYLLLIYSNAENWEHPMFLHDPRYLALPGAEREELVGRAEALHREITESGELVAMEALADPVNTRTMRVSGGLRSPRTGRTWRPRSSSPGTSWWTARARSVRRRSRQASISPSSRYVQS